MVKCTLMQLNNYISRPPPVPSLNVCMRGQTYVGGGQNHPQPGNRPSAQPLIKHLLEKLAPTLLLKCNVHVNPKYIFFCLNKSLHLFETHLAVWNLILTFMGLVLVLRQKPICIAVKAAKYEIQKPSTCRATLFRCKFSSMFSVFHLAWSTWPATKTFVAGWRKLLRKV